MCTAIERSTLMILVTAVCNVCVCRSLPSPSIPTPTSQEMQDIVEYVVGGRDSLNLDQVRIAACMQFMAVVLILILNCLRVHVTCIKFLMTNSSGNPCDYYCGWVYFMRGSEVSSEKYVLLNIPELCTYTCTLYVSMQLFFLGNIPFRQVKLLSGILWIVCVVTTAKQSQQSNVLASHWDFEIF